MNSWSSGVSGPLSSSPDESLRRSSSPRAVDGGAEEGGCNGAGLGPGQVDVEGDLLPQPLELALVLLVVRLELHQRLEDAGGLLPLLGGEVGLDELRVGLGDERVVLGLAIELDELRQAPDVAGIALHDLLQQGRATVDLATLDEPLDRRHHAIERLVVAPFRQVDAAELLAGFLVVGIANQQRLERGARVVGSLRAETRLGEPQRDLPVVRRRTRRLPEQVDGARVVLLHQVDARRRRE